MCGKRLQNGLVSVYYCVIAAIELRDFIDTDSAGQLSAIIII